MTMSHRTAQYNENKQHRQNSSHFQHWKEQHNKTQLITAEQRKSEKSKADQNLAQQSPAQQSTAEHSTSNQSKPLKSTSHHGRPRHSTSRTGQYLRQSGLTQCPSVSLLHPVVCGASQLRVRERPEPDSGPALE